MISKLTLVAAIVLILFGSYNALTLPAKIESYRIVFLHVPSAITAYVAFAVSFVCAIRYLQTKDTKKDILAFISAKFGILMATIAFISGAIWAKATWGAFFSWYEVREVLVLLLLFVYTIYFMLRNLVEEKERISAVYLIIAFVTVPFSYVASFFSPLHPRPFEAQFSPEWLANLFLMLFAFVTLFFSYVAIEYRSKRPKDS